MKAVFCALCVVVGVPLAHALEDGFTSLFNGRDLSVAWGLK